MKVRIIGCHGGVAPGYQTTCFMVDDRFLIDCGSASSALTPAEQKRIEDIFITHPHLDHVKDICFILENTFSPDKATLTLRSTPEVLKDIQTHLLNDVLWPDFSKIYLDAQRTKPALAYAPLSGPQNMDGVIVRPFTVRHPGNACGFVVDDGRGQILFTGDSGPCESIWREANACPTLKAIFTEISFPDRMDGLARASGHFTLSQLLADLKHLQKPGVPVYISHFKPLFFNELMIEFNRAAPPQLKLMHEDDIFEFA